MPLTEIITRWMSRRSALRYQRRVFFDSDAWPPAPDGFDPTPQPRLNAAQERTVLRTIGILLVVMFLGPFAGSSVVDAIWVLIRAI